MNCKKNKPIWEFMISDGGVTSPPLPSLVKDPPLTPPGSTSNPGCTHTLTKKRAPLLHVCYCLGDKFYLKPGKGPRRRLLLSHIFCWSLGSHRTAGCSAGPLYWLGQVVWKGCSGVASSRLWHWENWAKPWQLWFPDFGTRGNYLISPYSIFKRELGEVPKSITMEMIH